MTLLLNVAAACATGLALASACACPAWSHDVWADGNPVPGWVKRQCCGADDVHHLRRDQVHVTQDGYKLDGYGTLVPENRLVPSPDGEWWVFYRNYPDGSQSTVYCFFGPLQGS